MKRFHFSLQGALSHRLHLQEDAQRALAVAQRDLVEKEETRIELEKEFAEVEMSRPSQGSAEVILHSVRYMETLKMAILRAKEQIEVAKSEVEKARIFLAERNRDVKALEILRDKQKEAFRKEMNASSTKLLDDLAGIAVQRREPIW